MEAGDDVTPAASTVAPHVDLEAEAEAEQKRQLEAEQKRQKKEDKLKEHLDRFIRADYGCGTIVAQGELFCKINEKYYARAPKTYSKLINRLIAHIKDKFPGIDTGVLLLIQNKDADSAKSKRDEVAVSAVSPTSWLKTHTFFSQNRYGSYALGVAEGETDEWYSPQSVEADKHRNAIGEAHKSLEQVETMMSDLDSKLKPPRDDEAAAVLQKQRDDEAAAVLKKQRDDEAAVALKRQQDADSAKSRRDEVAVSAVSLTSAGFIDIKTFLVQNCEMSELKAHKLTETLCINEIMGMKRLRLARRRGTLDPILNGHQPALSEDDVLLILSELDDQDLTPAIAARRTSASMYQWNPSPMCVIENVAPITDRITSRGGILTGTYTHKQKKIEVVIKCYTKDRDLKREVLILTKLGDHPSWIMFEYLHDCIPIENSYLVLEKYGVNLDIYLRHLDINLSKVNKRIVVKEICHAIHGLHGKGVMHGDLKPQNILVREHGGIHVKLCDFDSARDVRERELFPNDGCSLKFTREYVSPEVFCGRNLCNGILAASLEIDLFALGLICAWLLDSRVNSLPTLLPVEMSDAELERYLMDQPYLSSRLQCDEGMHYRSCIHQFCSVEPRLRGSINDILPQIDSTTTHYSTENQRLQADNEYIKQSHERIMQAFQHNLDSFGNNLVVRLNTANGAATSNAWKLIEKRFDEQAQRIEVCVDMQTAQSRMLGTVISGTYSIPTLCVVLPQVNRTVWSRLNPINLHIITDAYRMFFICSHTLRIVPCGPKGKGYKFSETKQWVKRAAPVLKVGLILLKLGLLASGLPLPIPGLEGILDKDNSISFIDKSIHVLDVPCDDKVSAEQAVTSLTIDDHLISLNHNDADIRTAYEAIKALLTDPSKGLDKQLQHLNMIQRTCESTGITGWIRNDPVIIKSFDDNKGRRV